MGRLGAILGVLGRSFGDWGPSWVIFGASWGLLGPSWNDLGSPKARRPPGLKVGTRGWGGVWEKWAAPGPRDPDAAYIMYSVADELAGIAAASVRVEATVHARKYQTERMAYLERIRIMLITLEAIEAEKDHEGPRPRLRHPGPRSPTPMTCSVFRSQHQLTGSGLSGNRCKGQPLRPARRPG